MSETSEGAAMSDGSGSDGNGMAGRVLDLLTELRGRGIIITLAPGGDQLKVNAPKGAIDDAVKASLTARRDEILTFLREAADTIETDLPPLSARPADAPPRLSAAQDRVWRLHRLDPDSGVLNIAVPWRLRGPLDVRLLERSLAVLAERHETLRCRFPEVDGAAGLTVADDGSLPVVRFTLAESDDHGEGSGGEPIDRANRLAEAFAARPFDLATGVARVGLIELAPDDHVLVMVFHQIIFDWGAANPLVADLAVIHEALAADREPELEPLAVGYLDFAEWQAGCLAEDHLAAQRRWWAGVLERHYQPLSLPVRPPAEAGADDAGTADSADRLTFQLSTELTDELAALSKSSGATLFMTLMGAWQALLAGYGDHDEAIVFSLLGLKHPELKRLIGLFANPLPIRVALDGEPTVVEVIDRVRVGSLGAFSNQDLPLGSVMEQLRIAGPGAAAGPFQSLFIFQHEPTPPLQLGEATAELLTVGDHAAAFDLRLFAEDTDRGLRGWLEFDDKRFDEAAAARLLDQFVEVLGAMVNGADQPMATLLPVTDEDRAAAAAAVVRSGEAGSVSSAPTQPSTDRERELVELWSRLFDREVGIDDDFFALGGHSLLAISMFAEVEAWTGRKLPLATLFEAPNIRALAPVLDQDDWQLQWTSLVPIKPTGSKPPIFCVSALGDEIVQFGEMSELLADDQPFYALQQGLDRTDTIRTTIPDIAAHYLSEIRTIQPDGPYVIAGYCFGGLVAYEMAQQLQAGGEAASPLLMIEAEAPGAIYAAKYSPAERVRRTFTYVRSNGAADTARYVKKRLLWLWRWFVWTRLRHHLHRGFDRVGKELPESLKDILQINAQAADDYGPAMVPYDGNIAILRAEQMTQGYVYEDQLGWDRLIRGRIVSHWLPGDHEGIWKQPNVEVFAKQLEAVIEDLGDPTV